MRFRIHSTLGLTVTMAVVVVGACGDTAMACSGGGCCEGSWKKRLCGGATTCPSPGVYTYSESPEGRPSIVADSSCGKNYLWVTAKGFPYDSRRSFFPYENFEACSEHSNVLYEEAFRYVRGGQLCWNAPRTNFRLSGTRKIHIFTQGNPYNAPGPSYPTAKVSGCLGWTITPDAVDNPCGILNTVSAIEISKKEGQSAPPQPITISWPPDATIEPVWSDDQWSSNSPQSLPFICYLKNHSGGSSPCVPGNYVKVGTLMAAEAQARTDEHWAVGAQLDIEMIIDLWEFEIDEP